MLSFSHSHKKKLVIILILSYCLLTAGCWDRKEIDTRGYVLGVAIDFAQPEPQDKSDLLEAVQTAGAKKYRVSLEFKQFRTKSSGGDKPGSGEEESLVFAAEGESLFAIIRAINTQFPSELFFEDNQLLVFSEAVARDGIRDIVDFFERDPEFRRKTKVFITSGRAEDILKLKTKSKELPSMYIARISRNVKKSPTFASTTEIGLLTEKIRNNQSIALPMLIGEGDNVKATGAALFNRKYKMVGTYSGIESQGGKLLRRRLDQGVFVVPNPANPDKIATFELFESEIKVEPFLEKDMLWFRLEAKFIGSLAENQVLKQNAFNPAYLAALERSLAEEFAREANASYIILQETRTDVVELGVLVHQKYPQYWKTIESRWDEEIFPTVPLAEVNIKVIIRNTAMTH